MKGGHRSPSGYCMPGEDSCPPGPGILIFSWTGTSKPNRKKPLPSCLDWTNLETSGRQYIGQQRPGCRRGKPPGCKKVRISFQYAGSFMGRRAPATKPVWMFSIIGNFEGSTGEAYGCNCILSFSPFLLTQVIVCVAVSCKFFNNFKKRACNRSDSGQKYLNGCRLCPSKGLKTACREPKYARL